MAAIGILYQSLLETALETREEFAGPIRRLQLLPLGFEISYRQYILYTVGWGNTGQSFPDRRKMSSRLLL